MISPIQRTSQTDKANMPLRGEGNQGFKPIVIEVTCDADIVSKGQVQALIFEIDRSINYD